MKNNLLKSRNIRTIILLLLFIPIFYNYFFRLIPSETRNTSISNPDFINILLSLALFIVLYFLGTRVKVIFNLSSISISIIFYLFSFFIIDNYFLFLTKFFTFKQIFIFVNIIWLLIFIVNKNINNLEVLFFIIVFFIFQKYVASYIFLNYELTPLTYTVPDETDVWLPATTYLFENNYFYALNNVSHNGYGLLITHINSVSTQIFYYLNNYLYFPLIKNVFFFLTLLFINEIKVRKISKLVFLSAFLVVTLNSHWFRYLFFNSLMMENAASYFFGVLIYSMTISSTSFEKYLSTLLVGVMYFSKQFLSALGILFLIYLFIQKRLNKKQLLIGLSPILISLSNALFLNVDITWSNYFKFFNGQSSSEKKELFNIDNILNIINQFLIDKPVSYFLFIFVIIFMFNFKSNYLQFRELVYIVAMNSSLVFILYTTVWSDVEYGSSYRYLMNIFHLLIPIYLVAIDKFIFSNKKRPS